MQEGRAPALGFISQWSPLKKTGVGIGLEYLKWLKFSHLLEEEEEDAREGRTVEIRDAAIS